MLSPFGSSQVITQLVRTVGIGVNWHQQIATTTRSAVFSGVLLGWFRALAITCGTSIAIMMLIETRPLPSGRPGTAA
ncbi:hypothetical protein [Rhizobium mesosinicum]|uniref:Uncharacterized protein n=1 Tax=Rhizobium mesosinicum TaxID=335017 RepID=A0ABS7GWX8_9HYPH|nr:hypothetical protein [Rhizobium mesosinicum]MBW9054449.1 hypothetical protein [Rhizobium mesosinicum]